MTIPAPAPGPTLTLSTDKTTYNVGEVINLTVDYADAASVPVPLVITVHGSDAAGNTVEVTTTVSVAQQHGQAMTISATDSFNGTWAVVSNNGTSQALLQSTVGVPPA